MTRARRRPWLGRHFVWVVVVVFAVVRIGGLWLNAELSTVYRGETEPRFFNSHKPKGALQGCRRWMGPSQPRAMELRIDVSPLPSVVTKELCSEEPLECE